MPAPPVAAAAFHGIRRAGSSRATPRRQRPRRSYAEWLRHQRALLPSCNLTCFIFVVRVIPPKAIVYNNGTQRPNHGKDVKEFGEPTPTALRSSRFGVRSSE